jgi:thiol-disulfide isomerase/thioredoxin
MNRRILTFALMMITAVAAAAQSRRVPQSGNPPQGSAQSADNALTVKQMYEEANGYLRTKVAEFELKKVPFSESLLAKTRLEQRQLAAKYATMAGSRTGLAGDDLYYLGMLHWIAENLDATAEHLRKFIALADGDAGRRQTARSVVTVVLAKQKKLDDAESLLKEYLRSEPTKQTERARMEGELAKAFQTQEDLARMAPHAREYYRAAKALLSDASSRARGLDEIRDAGMLVFESWRDIGDRAKADEALEDMRVTAAETGSTSFYYYAVDQKVKYLVDTGRKTQAMEFYDAVLANVDRDFPVKEMQSDAKSRLKKKEKHYKLLGEAAPEFTAVDQWFPGQPKTFASLKGKVVLLDFWATWCGPCLEAFPSLIEWHQENARDGFEILGVTRYYGTVRGMPADKANELEFLKQYRRNEGLPYPFVVSDGQALQLQYAATGLPTAVLIDRKGVIRYIESGTSPSRLAELREMILKLLAEK